jgi:hypothetical protein
MTEAEWLTCTEPREMLAALHEIVGESRCVSCSCWRIHCVQKAGFCPAYRKLRLFTLDCCLRLRSLLPNPVCEAAIQALGEYIEEESSVADYTEAATVFDTVRRKRFPKTETPDDGAWNALYCSIHRKWREEFDEEYAGRRWQIADTVSLRCSTLGWGR